MVYCLVLAADWCAFAVCSTSWTPTKHQQRPHVTLSFVVSICVLLFAALVLVILHRSVSFLLLFAAVNIIQEIVLLSVVSILIGVLVGFASALVCVVMCVLCVFRLLVVC